MCKILTYKVQWYVHPKSDQEVYLVGRSCWWCGDYLLGPVTQAERTHNACWIVLSHSSGFSVCVMMSGVGLTFVYMSIVQEVYTYTLCKSHYIRTFEDRRPTMTSFNFPAEVTSKHDVFSELLHVVSLCLQWSCSGHEASHPFIPIRKAWFQLELHRVMYLLVLMCPIDTTVIKHFLIF